MKFGIECSRAGLSIEAGRRIHLWAALEPRSFSRWDLWRESGSLCIRAGRLAVEITLPLAAFRDRDGAAAGALGASV